MPYQGVPVFYILKSIAFSLKGAKMFPIHYLLELECLLKEIHIF